MAGPGFETSIPETTKCYPLTSGPLTGCLYDNDRTFVVVCCFNLVAKLPIQLAYSLGHLLTAQDLV